MKQLPLIWIASKRGKEKGNNCSACYVGWGLVMDKKGNIKVSKCLFCN